MLASNVQDVEAERANEKKLIHRFKVQGSCSNAQHFTCPAYHKKLSSQASIVHEAKEMLKASPTTPYFKSWCLSTLQTSSNINILSVPVFLINRNTSFFLWHKVLKDYTDIFLNKKQAKRNHQYLG